MRIAIVAGRFNDHVTKPLLDGALDTLHDLGLDDVPVYWVPGAFEIPLVAQRLAPSAVDAVICLGAVIRGDTPHFDYVAGECAAGIRRVALDTGVPVVFGVLTTDDLDQAMARTRRREHGHKGSEAARTAVEMVSLLRQLSTQGLLMLRLVLPKGSLEAPDPPAVRRRRPRRVARLRRRVPRHASTTRASTRCASSARRRSRSTWPKVASTSASPGATGSKSATPTS